MKLRSIAPVAAMAVTCIVFSGCSSQSGTSSSTTTNSGSKLTGTPINIMGSAALSGTNSPYPEVAGGMKAAVAQINDSGGINGHPLNLTICDTQGNPNIAQSCAQQAVASKDVAVLGPANLLTTSVIPTLQQAGIALVGADVSDSLDTTSPISFPGVAGGYDFNDAVGAVAKQVGCTKVGSVIIQAPNITQTIATAMSSSLKNSGITYTGPVYAPVSQTNFSSTLAAIQASGANCVALAIDQPQTTAFLTAWKQSGSSLKVLNPGTTLASLNTISSVASGIYVYSPVRLATDPEASAAVAAVNKYAPGTAISARSVEAWGVVQLLKQALKSITGGTYDAKTVLAAMGSLNNATSGNVLPPYTTTKDNPVAGQARVFNHDFVIYQVEGTSTKTVSNWIPIPGVASNF